MPSPAKIRSITGSVLSNLVGVFLIATALLKFIGSKEILALFEKLGLANWRIIIGIGEFASAVLFTVPRTAVLGTLLLSSYLGGAIVTNMQHGESFVFPAILLVVVWVAAGLRMPELFQTLIGSGRQRNPDHLA
jgi:DoxX-like family